MNLLFYGKHDLLMSDHRPVSLFGEVEIKCVIDYKFRDIRDQISQEYDILKGKISGVDDTESALQLSEENLVFKDVKFGIPFTQVLKLMNMIKTNAEFEFIGKDNERICPSWMNISSKTGIIIAGGSLELKITISIDKNVVSKVNKVDGSEFKDTLYLHVFNGPTYEVLSNSDIDFNFR